MSNKAKKEILDWVKVIVTALVLAFIITRFIVPSKVQGISMYPTLKQNDYLIVNRMSYKIGKPKFDDIVVFKSKIENDNGKGNKDLVKRVIGREGDHLQIRDTKVYINRKLLHENYIHNNLTSGDIDMVIPKGKIFAMGDNRERSLDSRYQQVGLVDKKDIVGKVEVRLYPFNKIGLVK